MVCTQLSIVRRIRALNQALIDEGPTFPQVEPVEASIYLFTSEHLVDRHTAKMRRISTMSRATRNGRRQTRHVLLLSKPPSLNSRKPGPKSGVQITPLNPDRSPWTAGSHVACPRNASARVTSQRWSPPDESADRPPGREDRAEISRLGFRWSHPP